MCFHDSERTVKCTTRTYLYSTYIRPGCSSRTSTPCGRPFVCVAAPLHAGLPGRRPPAPAPHASQNACPFAMRPVKTIADAHSFASQPLHIDALVDVPSSFALQPSHVGFLGRRPPAPTRHESQNSPRTRRDFATTLADARSFASQPLHVDALVDVPSSFALQPSRVGVPGRRPPAPTRHAS